MKTKYILLASLAILLLAVFLSPSSLPISPLGVRTQNTELKIPDTRYVIFGFAPYWNLKKLSPESLQHISHFAYFNLLLGSSGNLHTKVNPREEEPGFTNYKRLISGSIDYAGLPLIITFMPESQEALESVLSSESRRRQAINTIAAVLKESRAVGVNVDFEPLGAIAPTTRDNYTSFIKDLKSALCIPGSPCPQISVSIYASAGVRPRLWDLAKLREYADFFVVMTYDYTLPGSSVSGPNSPLRGAGNLFEHDIVKNIAEISKLVPSTKLLLGIPFYGYEWDTRDSTKYSSTENRASVASLERIQKMLDEKTLELVWDRNSLTPYAIASSGGQISQIYFENETSIRLKLEFVKSAGLGGIAIWALGYEGAASPLWSTIDEFLP